MHHFQCSTLLVTCHLRCLTHIHSVLCTPYVHLTSQSTCIPDCSHSTTCIENPTGWHSPCLVTMQSSTLTHSVAFIHIQHLLCSSAHPSVTPATPCTHISKCLSEHLSCTTHTCLCTCSYIYIYTNPPGQLLICTASTLTCACIHCAFTAHLTLSASSALSLAHPALQCIILHIALTDAHPHTVH